MIPVVMLFSIGTFSGILATIALVLPPTIRLISFGIQSSFTKIMIVQLSN